MEDKKLILKIDKLLADREKFRKDLEVMLQKEVTEDKITVLYDNDKPDYDFVYERWDCNDQLIIKRYGNPKTSIDTVVQFNTRTYKLPTFIHNKN